MTTPVAGLVAPPGWQDPSPAEFGAVAGVATVGVALDLGPFDWHLDRIATTEDVVTDAAVAAVARGATAVGIVGTPFGWAGLGAGERPHHRNARIASACGTPVVSAVSGVLDWLDDLGARRVALAATYYDRDWCRRWSRFVTDQGLDVTACSSMADLGIVGGPIDAADETHWAPTPEQIEHTVAGIAGPADAVVVTGAGARTLSCHERLCAVAGVPVVSSDLGLYRALVRAMSLPTRRASRRESPATAAWWPVAEVGA